MPFPMVLAREKMCIPEEAERQDLAEWSQIVSSTPHLQCDSQGRGLGENLN